MIRSRVARSIGLFALFAFSAVVAEADDLPDPQKTPGDAFPVTKDQICQARYTACVRHVSNPSKIYKSYGIKSHKPKEYEIDHLISLELGGSNDEKNLWPQSYITEPRNAHVKDFLENKLNELVCSNQISLKDAQHAISTNWIDAFDRYGGRATPPKHSKRISEAECRDLHDKLW